MIKLRSLILNTINIRCIKRMKNNIFAGLDTLRCFAPCPPGHLTVACFCSLKFAIANFTYPKTLYTICIGTPETKC